MTAAIVIEDRTIGKDDVDVDVDARGGADEEEVGGTKGRRCYDVCIIGAGPAGLASLSAIMEPYSLDGMTNTQVNNANRGLGRGGGGDGDGRKDDDGRRGMGPTTGRRVCVIDPNESWLGSWHDNFAR